MHLACGPLKHQIFGSTLETVFTFGLKSSEIQGQSEY